MDVENIAAAIMYLDACHGCVLQSTTRILTDGVSGRGIAKAIVKPKREWSRDMTPATSPTSPVPSTRTSTSISTDTNTDSSPLVAKQEQSQRPGVFDINTGSTAFPEVTPVPVSASSQSIQQSLKVRLLYELRDRF